MLYVSNSFDEKILKVNLLFFDVNKCIYCKTLKQQKDFNVFSKTSFFFFFKFKTSSLYAHCGTYENPKLYPMEKYIEGSKTFKQMALNF